MACFFDRPFEALAFGLTGESEKSKPASSSFCFAAFFFRSGQLLPPELIDTLQSLLAERFCGSACAQFPLDLDDLVNNPL